MTFVCFSIRNRICNLTLSAAFAIFGCGPGSGSEEGGGTDATSDGGTGSTGTTMGSDSHGETSHGPETETTTEATTAGGGCAPDVPCDGNSYCDFIMNSCGKDPIDAPLCAEVPEDDDCPDLHAPACGCDGNVYPSDCAAAQNAIDVDAAGGCQAPDGMFPCGYRFCTTGEYCQFSPTDVLPSPDSYGCIPLPRTCGDRPSCDCLENEPCAEFGCAPVRGGGLRITCPGG